MKNNDSFSIDIKELPSQEKVEYKVIYSANPYLMVEGNLIDVKVTLDSKFDEHWKKMIISPIYSLESKATFKENLLKNIHLNFDCFYKNMEKHCITVLTNSTIFMSLKDTNILRESREIKESDL